jgi:hypothetical protein
MALAVVVVVAGVAIWTWRPRAGIAQINGPMAGQVLNGVCTVYVRGDVSGMAMHERMMAVGNLISCTGKVVQLNDQWLVLTSADQTWWIPRTSIALVSCSEKP